MLRSLRLTAALLAGLVSPALAQTAATPPVARPTPPTAAMPPVANRPVVPATPVPATPIPATPGPAPAASRAPAIAPMALGKRIDLNGATEADLAALPGIGPVTAKNIVAGRPWDDTAELVKKKAMTQATFERNQGRFALANINSSSVADMSKTLPGIGDARARKIAEGRPYAKPDDLVGKNVLTGAQYDKIKDLVTY